jgi:hypothetical protein
VSQAGFKVAVSFFKPMLMPRYWFAFLPLFTDGKASAIR